MANCGGSIATGQKTLNSMGVTFSILDETRWNDMSAIDVLLAVQSRDARTYDSSVVWRRIVDASCRS